MEEFLQDALKFFSGQLGPGGFALLLISIFFGWRSVVRDIDDREDREQMALEANARSEAMLKLSAALDNMTRNQEAMRVNLADLRNILERVNTRLERN